MLGAKNVNSSSPRFVSCINKLFTLASPKIPVENFSIKKFKVWRNRIHSANLSFRRLGSNKDSWNPPHTMRKLATGGWHFFPVHSQYKVLVFRKIVNATSGTVPALYRYGRVSSLGSAPELLTVKGYGQVREFTIPALGQSSSRAIRFNMLNKTLWCESSPLVRGVSSHTTFFYRWYREFSWSMFYYLFVKIRYKGKSYKWYRRGGGLVLRFGHSHAVSVRIPSAVFSKKLGRMKLLFFGTSRYELRRFLSSSIAWRPMNIYNGRGLRFARQIVQRKAGKVSAYR